MLGKATVSSYRIRKIRGSVEGRFRHLTTLGVGRAGVRYFLHKSFGFEGTVSGKRASLDSKIRELLEKGIRGNHAEDSLYRILERNDEVYLRYQQIRV